ncbi:hypothetical protein ACWCQK_21855 [Streptomyces sp. NPDC002306]
MATTGGARPDPVTTTGGARSDSVATTGGVRPDPVTTRTSAVAATTTSVADPITTCVPGP